MAQELQTLDRQLPAAGGGRNLAAPIMDFSARQVALIHRTVCKDASQDELNFFIELCRHRGLDPFRRQVYCVIYNRSDANRRQMVVIVSIDGQRTLAQRCGNYRPAETPTEFETDETLKNPTNPEGLVLARVKLWIDPYRNEHWHPVIGEARWTEFAPIKMEPEGGWEYVDSGETWADSGRPKKSRQAKGKLVPVLDDSGLWPTKPRLMLSKCATMQALRAGWPDEFGGLYALEETDRLRVVDMDASDIVEQQAEQDRLQKVKVGKRVAFTFGDAWGIDFIEIGQIADRIVAWLTEEGRTAEEVRTFATRNAEGLREFWGLAKGDALEIRKRLDAAEAELEAREKTGTTTTTKAKGGKAKPAEADAGAAPAADSQQQGKERLV